MSLAEAPKPTEFGSALLLRREAVAAMLDVRPRTFDRMVSMGQFPTADIKLNAKLVRWKRSTVEAWVGSQGTK